MSSLINSASSGLYAAQAALDSVGNNLANYTVGGYTRRTTVFGQANSSLTQGGWIGNGVYVQGVQREYDAFITNQLRAAETQNSGLTTRYQQMSKIDDMLSDSTTNLSTVMQDFFTSMQTLVSNAEDPAARQTVLGKADGLVTQFRVLDTYLREQEQGVNAAIESSVHQINNYATQIANLNDQISRMTAAGGGAMPNDLLDQRDFLVSELNKIVGVDVSIQDSGTVNLTMGNGFPLVQGTTAGQLATIQSSADPTRMTVAYVDKLAGNIEIPEKMITTGSLGGLMTFRSQDLDQARNTLGQLAVAFADAFNQQHEAGFDANGDPGKPFFTWGGSTVMSNSKNNGTATLSAAITDSSAVQASNYKVAFDGTNWTVTRLSDNATITPVVTDDGFGYAIGLEFDGVQIDISGSAAARDSFIVKPINNVIIDMAVAISDPSELAMAAAAGAGASDNRNGQALLDLQGAKTVGGAKTFNDAYASLVSDIGNRTSILKTSSATQANVVKQLQKQQQEISGVNIDEEYINLQRFQQYYLANAQVLKTAQVLFDAIIQIR